MHFSRISIIACAKDQKKKNCYDNAHIAKNEIQCSVCNGSVLMLSHIYIFTFFSAIQACKDTSLWKTSRFYPAKSRGNPCDSCIDFQVSHMPFSFPFSSCIYLLSGSICFLLGLFYVFFLLYFRIHRTLVTVVPSLKYISRNFLLTWARRT